MLSSANASIMARIYGTKSVDHKPGLDVDPTGRTLFRSAHSDTVILSGGLNCSKALLLISFNALCHFLICSSLIQLKLCKPLECVFDLIVYDSPDIVRYFRIL